MTDPLSETFRRAVAEIETALGDQGGYVEVHGAHDELALVGNRIGFGRLAIETLKAAIPPPPEPYEGPADDSEQRFDSPFEIIQRNDSTGPAPIPVQTLKDKLFAIGCVLFALIAMIAFFRGCVALEHDVERWLR